MKLFTTLATACLAAITTALPVDAAAAGPARTFWGMPIIDHTPVPGTRRRSPTMHIIDKVPVPEENTRRAEAEADVPAETTAADSAIAKAFWGMPIIDHTPVPGTRRRAAAEVERRGKPFPVVDHKPVPDDGN